jgi:glycosyltransferase involved in cell wall biosynthesis
MRSECQSEDLRQPLPTRFKLGEQEPPLLSLVVCTIGRTTPLERLLASLRRQTFRNFEVVLVDQNPPGYLDPLLSVVVDLALKHVRSRAGLSHARNIGLQHAAGDLILFPDDDCWYADDFLDRLRAAFARLPERHILMGRTVDETGMNSAGVPLASSQRIDRSAVLAAGNSASLFARRHVFERIGLFDERLGLGPDSDFKSSEEVDLLVRAVDAGLRLTYCSDLTVFHEQVHPGDYATQLQRTALYARGFGAMLRKNRFGISFVGLHLVRTAAGIAVRACQGRPLLIQEKLTGSRNLLSGYLQWTE